MNVDDAAKLRAPFPASSVGKLPRVTCFDCRESREKVCGKHSKSRCRDCGNWISSAHMHLDYVGHADITDRLLAVDSEWTWEPLALDSDGLPKLDSVGGLWIKLTILGVTRLGYGDASGKKGGDAVKEIIGDGLRNAAMRFGVALDLWRKEPADDAEPATDAPAAATRRRSPAKATEPAVEREPPPKTPSDVVREQAAKAGYEGDDFDIYIATTYPNRKADDLTTDELQAEWKYFHELAKTRALNDAVMA